MSHMHIDCEMLKDSVLLIMSLRSSTCPLPAFIYAIPSPPTINSLILIRLDSNTQTTRTNTHMAHTQSDCLLIRTGSKNIISQGKWTHKTQLASANKWALLASFTFFSLSASVFSVSSSQMPVAFQGTVFVGTPPFSCSSRAISQSHDIYISDDWLKTTWLHSWAKMADFNSHTTCASRATAIEGNGMLMVL